MAYTSLALGLTLTIPTVGTRNWGQTLLNTTWTKISSHDHTGSGNGSQLGANSFSNFALTRDKLAKNIGLFPYTTLLAPSGTAQTVDFANGSHQRLDLQDATGDVDITLSNPVAGIKYSLSIIQGSTAREINWPASVLWPQGQKPILSTVENAVDRVQLYYDGSNYFGDWNLDYRGS